jgi:hypothetical protein
MIHQFTIMGNHGKLVVTNVVTSLHSNHSNLSMRYGEFHRHFLGHFGIRDCRAIFLGASKRAVTPPLSMPV